MLAIKNGNVIDPVSGTIQVRDVFIQNGYIVRKTGGSPQNVIDASGLYVAPGLVDIHVHFRDPGYEHKEDLYSGALAAAAGGFTTVSGIVNTNHVLDSPELIEYIYIKAS